MLWNSLIFIYLVGAIRISILQINFLLRLYKANRRGHILLKNKKIKVIMGKPISLLPVLLRGIFSIFLWPIDFLFIPSTMVGALIFFKSSAMRDLGVFYAKTNPFM